MYEMAKQVLSHEVYLYLPLSYDDDEGKFLAYRVVKEVSSLMDDGQTLREIQAKNGDIITN